MGWSRVGKYCCVFDGNPIDCVNLQPGVLRCYCPAHVVGQVDLHVTCDGEVISRNVKFEYKPLPAAYRDITAEWLKLKEDEFKSSILERLENVEQRLNNIDNEKRNSLANNSNN